MHSSAIMRQPWGCGVIKEEFAPNSVSLWRESTVVPLSPRRLALPCSSPLVHLTLTLMNNTPDTPQTSSPKTRMYVPLHVHSHYSILDGMAPVEKLVDKAVACGMPGIALTDHGAMYGIKNFTNYANDKINGDKLAQIKALSKQIKELEADAANAEEVARLQEEVKTIERSLFKAIIGCEVYVARRSLELKDKDAKDPDNPTRSIDRSGYHLILLAKNLKGYRNLIKTVSYTHLRAHET